MYLILFALIYTGAAHKYDDIHNNLSSDDAWNVWKTIKRSNHDFFDKEKAKQSFYTNLKKIKHINGNPNSSFRTSLNQFTDLSFNDFSSIYLIENLSRTIAQPTTRRKLKLFPPKSINWISAGKMTQIKDQGACKACWAFAAIAAIESKFLIKNRTKVRGNATIDMSEQQVISCATTENGYWAHSCNGGHSDAAIDYVGRNILVSEKDYPFTGTSSTCEFKNNMTDGIKLNGTSIPILGNRIDIQLSLVSAPVVIYFNVESDFMLYKSGIYSADNCTNPVNHAMLLVGYNNIGTMPYWIVRNSWGTTWGEDGYARIAMTNQTFGPCGMYTIVWALPNIA